MASIYQNGILINAPDSYYDIAKGLLESYNKRHNMQDLFDISAFTKQMANIEITKFDLLQPGCNFDKMMGFLSPNNVYIESQPTCTNNDIRVNHYILVTGYEWQHSICACDLTSEGKTGWIVEKVHLVDKGFNEGSIVFRELIGSGGVACAIIKPSDLALHDDNDIKGIIEYRWSHRSTMNHSHVPYNVLLDWVNSYLNGSIDLEDGTYSTNWRGVYRERSVSYQEINKIHGAETAKRYLELEYDG